MLLLKLSYFVKSYVRNYCTKVGIKPPLKIPQITKSTISIKPKIDTSRVSVQWTDQQLKIFDAIERRQSVFITGSAGTGKTVLIMEIINLLRDIHGRKMVSVTAPTGIVACSIGGQTLHSFAGVGLGEADAESLLSRVCSNAAVLWRWRVIKALVIDEISMVEGEFFDKLDYIARNVRQSDEPWGGIQLVVSGDFLQLPPVSIDKNGGGNKGFAFEANCWEECFQLHVCLNTIFRQSDPQLVKLLQGIRKGELDEEGLELLEQRWSVDEPDETVVRLYPRIEDVNRVNEMRLKELGTEIVVYEAFSKGDSNWVDQLERGIAPNRLELAKGARVMLVTNLKLKDKLVNGATGTITGFKKMRKGNAGKVCESKLLPIVKFDTGCEMVMKPHTWKIEVAGKVRATQMQIPLILAWAMSIHKSQGMTVDRLHTNLSKAFGYGMIYVALSRLRSLDGLSFSSDFHPSKIQAHPKVLEYYKKQFGEVVCNTANDNACKII